MTGTVILNEVNGLLGGGQDPSQKKLRMTNDGNCHPGRSEGSFRGRLGSFAKDAQDDK